MANPITSKDVAAVSAITAGSTLTGYTAASLLDWTKPYRVWRATGIATTEAVVIDFGATRTLQGVFIDNVNTASVKVQGHATNSWGSPSYDSGATTISLDRSDGRYKLFLNLSATTFASPGYRYMRLLNNSATALDSTTTWQVGSIAPLSTITTWAWPISYPYEMAPGREILGQGSNVVAVGNRFAEYRMTHPLVEEGSETSFADMFGYGEAEPFIFYRNYSSTAEAAPVRRVGAASWQKIGPTAISVPTFTLRGCD